MKAVVVHQPGGPEVLTVQEWPVPQTVEGKVLIRVRAFGLNHSEVITRAGGSGDMVKFPRVLGIECVGEVVEAPGSDLRPGQRVLGMSGGMGRDFDGGYAQYTLLPAENVVPIDANLEWPQLAAVPLTYGTAWGTFDQLAVSSGQSVLVHGGSTAAGMGVIALAKDRGVTVIATTRQESKRASLEKAGADHVLVLDGDPTAAVRELFPDGVDALAEFIGVSAMVEAMQAVKPGGRACITGFLSGYPKIGPDGVPDLEELQGKAAQAGVEFRFFGSNVLTRDNFGDVYQQIISAIEEGRLPANVDRVFAMDEVAEAHRYIDDNRAAGKLVVLTPED